MKKELENTDKKISQDVKSHYQLDEKHKGISYPRIKMDCYIIVTYLFADEKRAHAWKFFRNVNLVYIDGSRVGLKKKDYKSDIMKIAYTDEEMGLEPPKEEDKKKYRTKFGEYLFKSWDWVDRSDLDRFLVLQYESKEKRQEASLKYFGDKDSNVCDGLDYDFIRIDWNV